MSFNDLLQDLRATASQEAIDDSTLTTNLCWFCDKPQAERRYACEIYLNRNHRTEFGLSTRTHRWEELRRSVPCCSDCQRIHERANSWSRALAWLGGISGFVLGIVLPFVVVLKLNIETSDNFNGVVIFSIFGGALAGAILGYFLGRRLAFVSSPKTKPLKYAAEHPVVASLIAQGWKFGRPVEQERQRIATSS